MVVRRREEPYVEVHFQKGFFIDRPSWVQSREADRIVATELKSYLKRCVRKDVIEIARGIERQHGL